MQRFLLETYTAMRPRLNWWYTHTPRGVVLADRQSSGETEVATRPRQACLVQRGLICIVLAVRKLFPEMDKAAVSYSITHCNICLSTHIGRVRICRTSLKVSCTGASTMRDKGRSARRASRGLAAAADGGRVWHTEGLRVRGDRVARAVHVSTM